MTAKTSDRQGGPEATPSSGESVPVLLPLPLAGPYDYAVPVPLMVEAGDFVRVPLGSRQVVGVVWDRPASPEDTLAGAEPVKRAPRLKPIVQRFETPPMPVALRRFVDWVAAYTLTPAGVVLRMALRSEDTLEAPRMRTAYIAGGPLPERMTPARARVIEVALDGASQSMAELSERAGASVSVVKALIDAGTLLQVAVPADAPFEEPVATAPMRGLNESQREAAEALREAVQERRFSVTLLDGVTGSGKTEVYFEALAKLLEQGGQALVLLPEIALTIQFLERFEERFGCQPAEWHSDLSHAERRRVWRAVARGDVRIVVGARSALFLPFPDLRLIVVDEEHDRSFKQEDGVIYQARDMAVVRARCSDAPIVLASATPSLESLANVEAGRYHRLHLPERAGARILPPIDAVDLRRLPPERGAWLSPPLIAAVTETLAAGEQALLYHNRRGYAPLTLCRVCGHRLGCPNCQTWLVTHRFRNRLACHQCGYERPNVPACPNCKTEGALVPCGPGVERLAEEAQARWPEARLAILSSDAVQGPSALQAILDSIADGEVDLIIGTQMVAKGHNFPLLTLVGVVDADLGLEGGDLRAAERTYQLLQQVAGRAGRAERPGRALLQTYEINHPVIQALIAGDRDGFLEREADARRRFGLPPYGKLAALIVSGTDESEVQKTARALAAAAPRTEDVSVLGPAAAPFAMLRGRHRVRLLMKAARHVRVPELVGDWLAKVRIPGTVRVAVDIDPYSFL